MVDNARYYRYMLICSVIPVYDGHAGANDSAKQQCLPGLMATVSNTRQNRSRDLYVIERSILT